MPFAEGYAHGSYTAEYESSIKGVVTTTNPVFVVGTAPVNMAPEQTEVNKLTVIQSLSDAIQAFGTGNHIPGYTLTEAIFIGLQTFGVKPIVCVNVLDPQEHTANATEQALPVVNKKVAIAQTGILLATLIVKKGTDSTPIDASEYTASFEADGSVEVKMIGATALAQTTVDVEYDFLDPSLVMEADIIGTVDVLTGAKTGLQLIDNLFDQWSMIPSYVITPGYYSDSLRAILDTKASLINNKWQSYNSFYDLPPATKYGEAISYKKDHNWIDPDQYILFGCAKYADKYWNSSVFAAFLAASVNAGNEGFPFESPSNKNIKAVGIAYKLPNGSYKDIALSEEEANLLNQNGIATIIKRSNGTVLWGNRTSVYQPGGNMDPKDTLLCYKSVMKRCANDWILQTANDVDKPMTPSKVKMIQTNYQNYLDDHSAQGHLLGGRIEFILTENSETRLVDGKFRWHSFLGLVPPGESLENGLELDAGYLTSFWE
jgi:phage tail sheath protein FI